MPTELIESHIHKTVVQSRKNSTLKLLTSQSLFSSNTIDIGTNLLLRVIAAHTGGKAGVCLDLGCGYGPLGLSLAASGLAKTVELVDRDALAVDFAALNATENGLTQVEAHKSLGLDDASRESYDMIVSNLPGKAGSDVLRHFLSAASGRLAADGEFWGVVVKPLWPEIEQVLEELGVTLIHVEQAPRHTAFGFRIENAPSVNASADPLADIYLRDKVEFAVGRYNFSVETSRGISEFDALSYTTRLLLEELYELRKEHRNATVVFNVSQGYVPIALRAAGITDSVHLVDRDLLALRTTERNLRLNGLDEPANPLHHQVGWIPQDSEEPAKYDLIVGALRGDEPRRTLEVGTESLALGLAVGGIALISGGSTPITRMLKVIQARKDVRLLDRNRYRGSSVILISKPT